MAENESLARLATDLPKLLLEYKLAMAQMGSQEAHEMAMLQAKMGYETSIKDEKEKLTDVLSVIGSEHEKITRQRELTEQNITRLQEDIHKSKLQIEGLNIAMPKIDEVEKTADAYKLPDTIEKIANEPRLLVLQNEIDLYNEKRNQEATLQAHRKELETVFSRLTGLQIIGDTQVSPTIAGDPTLTQSDDFAQYFDEMLTQQTDPATGLPYPDTEIPGNSTRFNPKDDLTSYYRNVFVQSFSPTTLEVEKQAAVNRQSGQTQLSNYLVFSKEANDMVTNLQAIQINSIYKANNKGKAVISLGLDDDSAAYINAKTYIESMLDNPNKEMVEAHIQKAMSMVNVKKGETLINNLKKDKSGFLRGILDAMGSKVAIDEIALQVQQAQGLLAPNVIGAPGYTPYVPGGSTGLSTAASAAKANIFD